MSRSLRKQIQLGYWPGFIVGMYPSQFAYKPIEIDFDTAWHGVDEANLYFHIPFCKWSCTFCTFFKVVSLDEDYYARYAAKLVEQIRFYSDRFDRPVTIKSICFGGGTPNAIPARHYAEIFDALRQGNFVFDEALEPSMEISPETITEDYIREVAGYGVRRLSLGVQSLRDDLRRSVHRVRRLAIYDTIDTIRAHGLNINIDLINGIKGQDEETFMETLEKVVEIAPESISVYLLSGANTSLFKTHPDLMTTREKYQLFEQYYDYLLPRGYRCESHVKFVREDTVSTHQQKIYEYRGTPTLGIGCGARSYNETIHYSLPWHSGRANSNDLINQYIEDDFHTLPWTGFRMDLDENRRRAIIYAFFVGDLPRADYLGRFGTDPLDDYRAEFDALLDNDLVEITPDEIRLTVAGRRYTDLVGTLFWSEPIRREFEADRARPQPLPTPAAESAAPHDQRTFVELSGTGPTR